MSEEIDEYWIIKSVCTYRDFNLPSPPNFDGQRFFEKLRNELNEKNNAFYFESTSIDSGFEDEKTPIEIYNSSQAEYVNKKSLELQIKKTVLERMLPSQRAKLRDSCTSFHGNNPSTPKVRIIPRAKNVPSLTKIDDKNLSIPKLPLGKWQLYNKSCIIPIDHNVSYTSKTTAKSSFSLNNRGSFPKRAQSFCGHTSTNDKVTNEETTRSNTIKNNSGIINVLKKVSSLTNISPSIKPPKLINIKRSCSLGQDSKPKLSRATTNRTSFQSNIFISKMKKNSESMHEKIKFIVDRLKKSKIRN
uniref:Uncharacterized protein n=1 Tax=Parastrongyloides trichosuri TaxID=131310 RepID=A0A0N4ZJ59_PARTI